MSNFKTGSELAEDFCRHYNFTTVCSQDSRGDRSYETSPADQFGVVRKSWSLPIKKSIII